MDVHCVLEGATHRYWKLVIHGLQHSQNPCIDPLRPRGPSHELEDTEVEVRSCLRMDTDHRAVGPKKSHYRGSFERMRKDPLNLNLHLLV